MPVLSLHNTYSIPTGSASYTLGLSGAPGGGGAGAGASCGIAGIGGVTSYTYPGGVASGVGGIGGVLGAAGAGGSSAAALSSLLGTTGGGIGGGCGLSSTLGGGGVGQLGGYNTSTSYSTYTNPLLTSGAMNMKLKTYDEIDLISRYGGGRATTPNSPIPPAGSWGGGLDSYGAGLDGVNPTFMHTHSRHGGGLMELDCKTYFFTAFSHIHI